MCNIFSLRVVYCDINIIGYYIVFDFIISNTYILEFFNSLFSYLVSKFFFNGV